MVHVVGIKSGGLLEEQKRDTILSPVDFKTRCVLMLHDRRSHADRACSEVVIHD